MSSWWGNWNGGSVGSKVGVCLVVLLCFTGFSCFTGRSASASLAVPTLPFSGSRAGAGSSGARALQRDE